MKQTLTPPTAAWKDTALDCAAIELSIAKKRINELEADRDSYRELALESLQMIARLSGQNRELQGRLRDALSLARNAA